jgi:hypothetical protein
MKPNQIKKQEKKDKKESPSYQLILRDLLGNFFFSFERTKPHQQQHTQEEGEKKKEEKMRKLSS